MSIRLKCRSCGAAYLTSDDQVGREVACPKCGTPQKAPSTVLLAPETPAETSVFVPSTAEARRPARRRPLVWALVLLIPALAIAGVVAWPKLRAWWHPVPPDPIAVAAATFLDAAVAGDAEALGRVSTVADPPALRSYHDVEHEPARDARIKGSFRPIAELHARINESFEYDPEIGRFKTRNPLGPAAETLDALHDAKAKAEQDDVYNKIQSGDPEEIFDAAENLGGVFKKMAEGVLAPKKLVPTYAQLVQDAKPPLPPAERSLALDFGANRETWDALLKRPFPSLKADGPFVLDRAEVTAMVADKLASSGDPPSKLILKLVRFRLEGIDTGWKVVSARREGAAEPVPAPSSSPVEATPEKNSRPYDMPTHGTVPE